MSRHTPTTQARRQFLRTAIVIAAAVMAGATMRRAHSAGTFFGCGTITVTFALLRYL